MLALNLVAARHKGLAGSCDYLDAVRATVAPAVVDFVDVVVVAVVIADAVLESVVAAAGSVCLAERDIVEPIQALDQTCFPVPYPQISEVP